MRYLIAILIILSTGFCYAQDTWVDGKQYINANLESGDNVIGKVGVVNESGTSVTTTTNGGYTYLHTSDINSNKIANTLSTIFTTGIKQNVIADTNNSSSTNLSSGNNYTFTGTSSSTLGIAGIQVSLFADKNCIIKVEQSPDGNNWDLIDTYYYTANGNFGVTTQAISSYYRVVITTNNVTTTTFRLQTALCPIVEPLPRSLDYNGNLKVSTSMDNYGWKIENTPMGELRTIEPSRLVGATFEGSSIDSRFWTTSAAGTSTTIAQGNAQLLLTTGTSATSLVTAYSNRRARYVGGASMRYRAVVQPGASQTSNKLRWGIGYGSSMPTITDGAWFQKAGTGTSIVTCKNGVENTVTSFNGNLGATYDYGTTAKTYEIYWTNSKVYFVVGDEVLHLVTAPSSTWASTMNFNIFMDGTNSAEATSTTLAIRTASIYRLGKFETQPTYYNLTGNAATHVLKLGPGILHKIMFNNTSGTDLTIYDNTAGTGTTIGKITTASAALGEWDYSCPFNNGLSIVTTGNSLDATIIYE